MSTTSKAAHTPGPWEIDTSTSSQGHDIYSAGQEELLASVYPMKRDGIFESWKTNARLIAAAPEMLEALELLYSDSKEFHDDFCCDAMVPHSNCGWCAARAAIQKARGSE